MNEHPALMILPGEGSLFNRYVKGSQKMDPAAELAATVRSNPSALQVIYDGR